MLVVQVLLVFAGLAGDMPNQLSEQERKDGFILLFDGKTKNGWRHMGTDSWPDDSPWVVEDGFIHLKTPGRVDLTTSESFENFELRVQWKISKRGNSGIKYRLATTDRDRMLGPEYQILDDTSFPKKGPRYKTSALYALYPPKSILADGAVQSDRIYDSRIVACGNRVTHWLNGVKVLSYEFGSDDFEDRRKSSKFKKNHRFACPVPAP